MELRIPIPDEKAQRVLDAFAAKYGYTGTAENGTAQTKLQFVRQQVKDWITGEVREYEQSDAAAAARRNTPTLDI